MKIVGLLMMIAGVLFGVYAGFWWAFIGGIVDVISAVRAPELDAMSIAIGIMKVMFAGLIGFGTAFVCVLPGYALINAR